MIISNSLEASLIRAVTISLYTWRRAETDDPIDDEERYGAHVRQHVLRGACLTSAARRHDGEVVDQARNHGEQRGPDAYQCQIAAQGQPFGLMAQGGA